MVLMATPPSGAIESYETEASADSPRCGDIRLAA
jgi:hypothetical protein